MFGTRARARKITEKPLSHKYMIHECELFSGRHHTHFYAFTYVCACVGWRARLCTLFTDFSTLIAAAYTSRDFFFFALPPSLFLGHSCVRYREVLVLVVYVTNTTEINTQ